MKTNSVQSKLPPERVLEICNAINAAIVAGKTVTLDNPVTTTQIVGAIPGFGLSTEVRCISNIRESKDTAKVINARGHIIRAYRPNEINVDIIYDPNVDDD